MLCDKSLLVINKFNLPASAKGLQSKEIVRIVKNHARQSYSTEMTYYGLRMPSVNSEVRGGGYWKFFQVANPFWSQ